jgi:hypothetical protein
MERRHAMADKFTDIITYVLSLSLAAGVIAFAAYKVVALNGMENPPANLGLNFPAPKRKVIMDAPPADPLTTQALPQASRAVGAGPGEGALNVYELLTVVDGVAFVAIDGDQGKTLVPVMVGSTLPGGLTVTDLRRRSGRWVLVAGNLTLEQVQAPAQ